MPKFSFRLESLLEHRHNVERQKQRDLAQTLAIVAQIQQELRDVEQVVRDSTEDVRQKHLLGRIDMNFMAAHRRFMISMQRKATEAAQRLLVAERKTTDARLSLGQAARDRRMIELLREKQLAQWQADFNRQESLETDEIGMQLAYRNIAHESEEPAGEEALEFEPPDFEPLTFLPVNIEPNEEAK